MPEPSTSTLPLAGVRVLDLGRVVAGPHCALLLANAGAEVIKIERPVTGDDARSNGVHWPSGQSAYFNQQNMAKKSIAIDLRSPAGLAIVKDLVRGADVVVENFRPGTMERLGLSWSQLQAINPRLILCSISAYGHTGPDAGLPGYGAIAEARAGLPEMTGDPAGPPVGSPIPSADMLSASHGFGAICAALYARERTGIGERIDIALLDCAAEMQDWALEQYLASDGQIIPTRRGAYDRAIVPWGNFEASDGSVCMIVSNDGFWRKLTTVMGCPELGTDDRYATVVARSAQADEIYALVRAWARGHTARDLVAALKSADIPACKINTIPEVLQDPQLLARGMFVTKKHPTIGTYRVVKTAINYPDSPLLSPNVHAPELGEHTDEILIALGVEQARIDALHDTGAVYRAPRRPASASTPKQVHP